MAEVSIYALNLAAADFSYTSPAFRSSAWGGSDTPNASYPEFGEIENVHRAEAAGATGQDVIDAVNTADYTTSWVTLCGIGPLTNGQFDARGGGPGQPLKVRWKQFLKSSALAESGYCSLISLCNGAAGGTGSGLFSNDRFLHIQMHRTTGANFQWYADYGSVSGSAIAAGTVNPYPYVSNPGVADNAEHDMLITLVPSTVTGAYDGLGGTGTAVVANDGSWSLTQDGVTVISASGIQLAINFWATSNPAVYYGKTIWFGD